MSLESVEILSDVRALANDSCRTICSRCGSGLAMPPSTNRALAAPRLHDFIAVVSSIRRIQSAVIVLKLRKRRLVFTATTGNLVKSKSSC